MPNINREWRNLDRLLKALKIESSCPPIKSECPDFVLTQRAAHRIGIELTDFCLPVHPGKQPHQEWQSLKQQIVVRAEQLHADAAGLPLHVRVYFQHGKLSKRDVPRFARELAHAVCACPIPESTEDVPFELLPQWASSIRIRRSPYGDKLWAEDAGGFVAQVTAKQISDKILGKSKREIAASLNVMNYGS